MKPYAFQAHGSTLAIVPPASVVRPVAVSVPPTVTPAVASCNRSVVPLMPTWAPVNRTLSTSTYPVVLVMASPVVPVP